MELATEEDEDDDELSDSDPLSLLLPLLVSPLLAEPLDDDDELDELDELDLRRRPRLLDLDLARLDLSSSSSPRLLLLLLLLATRRLRLALLSRLRRLSLRSLGRRRYPIDLDRRLSRELPRRLLLL